MSFKTDALMTKDLPAITAGATVSTVEGNELTLDHAQRLVSDRGYIQVAFPDLNAVVLPDDETLEVEVEMTIDGGTTWEKVHGATLSGSNGIGSATNYTECRPENSAGNFIERKDVVMSFRANIIASANVVPPTEVPVLRYVTY